MAELVAIQADDLYNLLSTDNVGVLDLRDEAAFEQSHVRGAYRCWLDANGELEGAAAAGSSVPPWSARVYRDQQVVLYADDEARALSKHPVYLALGQKGAARELRVLGVGQFSAFEQRCARAPFRESRRAREPAAARARACPSLPPPKRPPRARWCSRA